MAISGQIVNDGDSVDITYSGGMQEYEIPVNGLYQLEVWGGQGGTWYKDGTQQIRIAGGKGGYSTGYKLLTKGTRLYIACGGQGGYSSADSFNGGAGGNGGYNPTSGGGATHIALISGTIANIGKTNFDTNGLIVAGGGGGASQYAEWSGTTGTGGGLTGGTGTKGGKYAYGGSQTAGGTVDTTETGTHTNGTFGRGGYSGGGGYYGGAGSQVTGGGGGSGWINGVPEITYKGTTYAPQTSNGVNNGTGKSKITLIAKTFPEMYVGNEPVEVAYLGTIPIDEFYEGSTPLD